MIAQTKLIEIISLIQFAHVKDEKDNLPTEQQILDVFKTLETFFDQRTEKTTAPLLISGENCFKKISPTYHFNGCLIQQYLANYTAEKKLIKKYLRKPNLTNFKFFSLRHYHEIKIAGELDSANDLADEILFRIWDGYAGQNLWYDKTKSCCSSRGLEVTNFNSIKELEKRHGF